MLDVFFRDNFRPKVVTNVISRVAVEQFSVDN